MEMEREVIMRRAYRTGFLAIIVVSFVLALSAQDSAPTLGDLARQERERKQNQSANPAQADATDAGELRGLTLANFKANILVNESKAATEKWVLMPAADKQGAGRIRQVMPGKKYFLPFVVTDYPYPITEKMNLTTHVRLISPAGKTMFTAGKFSENIGADPRSPSVIVLNPVMDVTFDPTDLPGTYTIRVTITDHVHSMYAKAEEKFELVQGIVAEGNATK
jgi:hypothetical protein